MSRMISYVVGVDLGGTHVSSGVVDEEGRLLYRDFRDIDRRQESSEILFDEVIPSVRTAILKSGVDPAEVKAVGIGLPGNLDSERGICHFSPNLKWREVEVRKPLQEKLELPVYILNDVRTATLGEFYFGAGRGLSNFVCVALGTGIGGGIIAAGQLLLGGSESAGEVGHITIEPEGPLCGCGNRGCLEALAAGPAIARRAKEALNQGRKSLLSKMTELTAREVADAALKGDELAIEIWRETGRILGIGLSSVITVVNPQRIAIGGRIAQVGEILLEPIREEVRRRARLVPENFTEIVAAELGENAGLIGAGALALTKMPLA